MKLLAQPKSWTICLFRKAECFPKLMVDVAHVIYRTQEPLSDKIQEMLSKHGVPHLRTPADNGSAWHIVEELNTHGVEPESVLYMQPFVDHGGHCHF